VFAQSAVGENAMVRVSASQTNAACFCQSALVQHSVRRNKRSNIVIHSIFRYEKRFFPYYAFNVLGGVDETGEGFVFGYDAVGNFEKIKWTANGSGQQLLMPLLDNQVLQAMLEFVVG
jgi:hypothetical protein